MQGMPGWIVLMAALASSPSATTRPGVHFEHHDWLLACDNTGTCRAAGYQPGGGDLPVSVLLTRHAGPGQTVTAEVQIGDAWDASGESAQEAFPLTLRIDGGDLGTVAADGALSSPQTAALLGALARDTRIEWIAPGGTVYPLSDHGAAAVLLKMDETQGRLGTPGALMRKGTRDESQVPAARPMPVIDLPALDDAGIALSPDEHTALLRELEAQLEPDACPSLSFGNDGNPVSDLSISGLSNGKRLVSAHCWLAAYNSGSAFWVINAEAPYGPVLVTTDGNEYYRGRIEAGHKGRGVGDCWGSRTWTWNGETFVGSHEQTTGLCRGFPGGAWSLPTLVSEVREDASPAGSDGR
ncbi:DUF1176 domain-containing protein [Lysobacter maris]|uniref:DUF1176 domain-containing protein n=2 Tax=Marilutibacter maris TaxID=1605891 RepID=A0A508ATJ4_9GAMM|nr:DUF1176 domain-containing protein [Lysobacter maris]